MSSPAPDYGIIFPNSISIDILPAEKYAEKFIISQIKNLDNNYPLSLAKLFGVTKDSDFTLLSEDQDIYTLLEESHDLSQYIGIIVFSTGWAAPMSDDKTIIPSQHEDRRRIALAACVTSMSTGSALSFFGNPEIILDNGSATGTLAEALSAFWLTNI